MRATFLVTIVLVSLAALELFVLTGRTDRLFAWTIEPRLTEAFLGANYLAAIPLQLASARRTSWAHARIGVLAVFAFAALTLVATLVHHDRFHFGSSQSTAVFAAWAWLAVYVLFPVATVGAVVAQLRVPGADPLRTAPIPRPVLGVVAAQGALMLALGAVLFIVPSQADRLWPWDLTPLTARAVAAWLIGLGIGALQVSLERDFDRVTPGGYAYALVGLLQLVALARYHGDVDWSTLRSWIYVLFVVGVLAVGLLGRILAKSPARTP